MEFNFILFRFSVKLRKADKVAQTAATAQPSNNYLGPRTGVLFKTSKPRARERTKVAKSKDAASSKKMGIDNQGAQVEPTTSDIHTVPSDLEVLLSESEFLFSDT